MPMSSNPIVFHDSSEPWSVSRGGVKRWWHCRIYDVNALAQEHQAELMAWLGERGIEHDGWLLVTRDESGGHRLHFGSGVVDVELADLPLWLQRPEPEPKPAKATKARK